MKLYPGFRRNTPPELKLFIQKLRIVFSEELRGRGKNTSEYLLTFGPINNTMVQGFAKNQVCLFVSIHLLIICVNEVPNNNYHLQLGQVKRRRNCH